MEKTFEELIQDKLKSDDGFYRGFVPKDEIKELLQQVREATKQEMDDIITRKAYEIKGDVGSMIIELRTEILIALSPDKIRIDENTPI